MRRWVALAAIVMTAAACGSADTGSTPSPSPAVTTPATTPSPAALVFKLNGVGTAIASGTITVTNIGVFGMDTGTPILNPGEAVILAMGAVRRMPWEHHDAVALRHVMTLSLSFDHRLVDGAEASRFLADIGTILSDPAMLLAMV